MTIKPPTCGRLIIIALGLLTAGATLAQTPKDMPEIRTPRPPAKPRINGSSIFGVRPGHRFFYHIPATGERPMEYSVSGLPKGLEVDGRTGIITGVLPQEGEVEVTLGAKNRKGSAHKTLRIVVGETIALTPPLGWNSWNCWGPMVDEDKVKRAAHAMVSSGLIDHGWSYINIDDAWQGKRGGQFNGIQPNEKFPDMKALCDEVHGLGLKIGIYSTPWITSYAGYVGGSADNEQGTWTAPEAGQKPRRALGEYSFARNDARQWAAWGMDYLKYDWNPNRAPETREMQQSLRESGRDIVISLSNSTPFTNAPVLSKLANCWRTTGDIRDTWQSMSSKGFGQDKWAPYQSAGHWNDPDMLVVGYVDVGRGRNLHPSRLTPAEQYTHITLWSLVCSPMLLGCDLERLDDFTLNLLSNDEVLAVHQDGLGKQATTLSKSGNDGELRVYAKGMADGSKAVGLFNLGDEPATVTVKWSDLKISGKQHVRDLWRQKDLGKFKEQFGMKVAAHGAELVKIQ